MTVKEIVIEYLKSNDFDGLFYAGECGCLLEDLMPCGMGNCIECEPGYKVPCPGPDKCEAGGHCGFHIARNRRE